MPAPTASTTRSGERSTIEHVASAAGVSVATVSRALRGLPNVAVSTRSRVEEVARELNYRADPAASRLAAGRSSTIAIVVPMINSWYFANVVAGAEAVCAEIGYDLLILTAPDTEARHKVVTTAAALDRRVDGLIFVEVALPQPELVELARHQLAVVTAGQETTDYPCVRIDNEAVGATAVDHLVALGHRRVGVVGAQAEEPACFDVPGQRIRGAELALAAAGATLPPELVVNGEFTVDGGYQAARRLLGDAHPPTAIFALSDEMAVGALVAARQLGFDVPGQLSVMGVDDHDIAAVMGLTTIRQHVPEHGASAVRALLARLTGGNVPAEALIGTMELVVRVTTGAAA